MLRQTVHRNWFAPTCRSPLWLSTSWDGHARLGHHSTARTAVLFRTSLCPCQDAIGSGPKTRVVPQVSQGRGPSTLGMLRRLVGVEDRGRRVPRRTSSETRTLSGMSVRLRAQATRTEQTLGHSLSACQSTWTLKRPEGPSR